MPNENSYEVALQKSNAIRDGLTKKPEKYTMLTGDRPTGRLHLGHYFGTLKGRVELQNMGCRTNVLIADYQVITDRDTTEHIQDNVYNMVMDYLAVRHRSRQDHDLRALCSASVPTSSCCRSSRSSPRPSCAQPHRQGRDGGLGPRAHGPSAHLSRAPGLRHPVLQGQCGARRSRPAAAHRAHAHHRPSL